MHDSRADESGVIYRLDITSSGNAVLSCNTTNTYPTMHKTFRGYDDIGLTEMPVKEQRFPGNAVFEVFTNIDGTVFYRGSAERSGENERLGYAMGALAAGFSMCGRADLKVTDEEIYLVKNALYVARTLIQ